ncbi:MAG: helix-turn-helix domain-containing protein [Burkholderiaceae bacterium]
MSTAHPFRPLSRADVADVFGVTVRTIENWVNDGTVPAPVKLGNRVYWHPGNFFAWLDHRLADEVVTAREPQQAAAVPTPGRAKPKSVSRSVATKAEQEKLHNRTQARLDSLDA